MAGQRRPEGTSGDGFERIRTSPLLVDLYELTMAQAYVDEGVGAPATFSLFVRSLPKERGYLVAAGLENVLRYVERFAFGSGDLAYLASTGLFTGRLIDYLADLRFTGSIRAVPEGTVCFADEPLLEVMAPIVEAQLLETVIINEIQLQTMIASKAARCVSVGGGRRMVDFSLRRVQGPATGLAVARASYLAGFEATSNVLAGQQLGIPIAGTMAHSYVEAFGDETEAFRAYARAYPDACVLLIDTYDVIQGAQRAAAVGRELAAEGHQLRGVRLDSGDLVALSRAVRAILNDAGLSQTIIFASGALDEYAIERVAGSGAPIDGFGVGTRLGVSADAPHLDLVYKLVAYDERPTLKLSPGKETWPGPKQVWRTRDEGGFAGDWLGLRDEAGPAGGEPLLREVMAAGRRVTPADSLDAARERCAREVASLPVECQRLHDSAPYPVEPTSALRALQREVAERLSAELGAPS